MEFDLCEFWKACTCVVAYCNDKSAVCSHSMWANPCSCSGSVTGSYWFLRFDSLLLCCSYHLQLANFSEYSNLPIITVALLAIIMIAVLLCMIFIIIFFCFLQLIDLSKYRDLLNGSSEFETFVIIDEICHRWNEMVFEKSSEQK